jgi:hypothetical protein
MNVAFGWHTPCARLYEIAADPLAGSNEEFLVGAGEKIKAIESEGLAITKEMIGAATRIIWTRPSRTRLAPWRNDFEPQLKEEDPY